MKIHELLSDESKWCKHTNAQDSQGFYTDSKSKEACKWCVAGAYSKCYDGEDYEEVWLKLLSKIREKYEKKLIWVSEWNDSPETTFEDVRNLLLELDI